MTPAEATELLADAVLAQLRLELDPSKPLDVFDSEPTPIANSDGLARPFAVLYAGPGTLGSVTLCDSQDVLTWRFQVTAGGGDPQRARRAAARVRARLSGVELMVGSDLDRVRLRLVEDPDYDPGPVRKDPDGKPPRWFIPMQYRPQVTTA